MVTEMNRKLLKISLDALEKKGIYTQFSLLPVVGVGVEACDLESMNYSFISVKILAPI